jgi:lysine 2,3-aminomutase
MAVPHFVVDAPGGGGKIPMIPNYVKSIDKEKIVLRNYANKEFIYPQPHD